MAKTLETKQIEVTQKRVIESLRFNMPVSGDPASADLTVTYAEVNPDGSIRRTVCEHVHVEASEYMAHPEAAKIYTTLHDLFHSIIDERETVLKAAGRKVGLN